MRLTLQTIPSTIISEILSSSNFDGVVLDTEHGCFNNESLYSCIQIITSLDKQCYVRVTDFNKQLIRMCLDGGVDGLIFSTIEDSVLSEEIIRYCNYPNRGGNRGMGLVRQNAWGNKSLDTYKPILMAQIETKKAVNNLSTLKECGFDYFVLGPYDLTSDLKCPGEWENEKYISHIQTLCDIIPRERLGIFLPTVKQAISSSGIGDKFSLVVWGMDTDFLKTGITGNTHELSDR